ncbi:MAG TPA: lipid-binding SYLF domain-containing protein [Pricia sp.]|nr:lipid-binding SYLF domain-containing protein [Pricia sp.]
MKIKSLALFSIMLITLASFSQSKKDKKIIRDADAMQTLLKADVGIDKLFMNSAGYVIFPNVGNGGFIVGGASGNGVVYEDGTAVGMADLKKINVGFQAGGQAIIEVIFFETGDALDEFKTGDFEFSAGISAVALKSGVAANAKYKEGVAVVVLPKAGLMADVSVGGQKFSYDPL